MRTNKLLLLFVICLLGFPARLLANAWMLDAGEGFAEVYNKFYWATQDYDYRGDRADKANSGRYEEFRSEVFIGFFECASVSFSNSSLSFLSTGVTLSL